MYRTPLFQQRDPHHNATRVVLWYENREREWYKFPAPSHSCFRVPSKIQNSHRPTKNRAVYTPPPTHTHTFGDTYMPTDTNYSAKRQIFKLDRTHNPIPSNRRRTPKSISYHVFLLTRVGYEMPKMRCQSGMSGLWGIPMYIDYFDKNSCKRLSTYVRNSPMLFSSHRSHLQLSTQPSSLVADTHVSSKLEEEPLPLRGLQHWTPVASPRAAVGAQAHHSPWRHVPPLISIIYICMLICSTRLVSVPLPQQGLPRRGSQICPIRKTSNFERHFYSPRINRRWVDACRRGRLPEPQETPAPFHVKMHVRS